MRISMLATLAVVLGLSTVANAQTTYTWNGGAGNGNWNVAGNWTGGLPVSGTNIIALNNTTQTTTTQNIASPFQLNQLNMLVDASNGFVVNGGGLQFTGSSPLISSAAAANLTLNVPLEFLSDTTIDNTANNPGARELTLAAPLTASAARTLTTTSSNTTPSTLTLIQSANPNFLGTLNVTGNTIVQTSANDVFNRSTAIASAGANSTFAVGNTAASGVLAVGIQTQLGSFTGSGQLQIGDVGTASTALVGFRNNATDTVTGNLAASNSGSHLAKVGTGTWSFTGTVNSTMNGTFTLRDGLVHFSSSSASSGGFGTASTGMVRVYSGGQFLVTLTGTQSNGRLGNTQPVTLSGGTLRYNLSGMGTSASGYSEVAGQLTAGAGQSTIQIDTATGRGSELSFSSISNALSSTGTVTFLSNSLGNSSRNTAGAGNVSLYTPAGLPSLLVGGGTNFASLTNGITATRTATTVTATSNSHGLSAGQIVTISGFSDASLNGIVVVLSAPTANTFTYASLTSGTLSSQTGGSGIIGTTFDTNRANYSILPFAHSGSASPTTFVTYDYNNASFRGLSDSNYAADFAGAATNNVGLAASTSVSAATTANALRLSTGGSLDNSSTLTLTAGAILNNGGGDVTGAGTLQFGATSNRTAFITTNGAFNISNNISAANLAKNGAGNLTLTGTTTLSGTTGNVVAANAGILTLGAGSSFTTSTALASGNQLTYQVSRSATLNVAANGLQLPAFTNLTGQGTVVGNVTVGASGAANRASGTITPSALAGAAANLASPGVLTVNGNLTLQQGGNYNWYISSVQGGPYTQSQIAVTGNLDLTNLSPTNKFTVRPTSLLLNNNAAGAVYDFNNNQFYQWPLITVSGTINGYNTENFEVDTSAFTNSLQAGWQFTIYSEGSTLVLTYAPIPEPTIILGSAVAVLLGGYVARKRRKQAAV